MPSKKPQRHRAWGRIEQLPSGNHRASFKGPDGVLYKAPQTFKEKRAAEAWLNRNKAEIDNAEAFGTKWISPTEKAELEKQDSITVEQLTELWITGSSEITKESTRQVHKRRLKSRVLNHPLAQMPVVAVDRKAIKSWWEHVNDTHPEQPTTNRAAYTCLKTAFEYARTELELIENNPVEIKGATKKPRPKNQKISALKKEQIDAIVLHINERLKAPILILAYAGLRIGEALELKRRDLEDDGINITIHVTRNAQRITDPDSGKQVMRSFDTPKTDAGHRTLVLPEKVSTHVREHLKTFVGTEPDAFLITTEAGKRMMDTNFRTRFKYAAAKAGRPDVGLHDFRRYFCTTMAKIEGFPLDEIRRLMGHSSVKQVLEYLRAEADYEKQAANMLNELI